LVEDLSEDHEEVAGGQWSVVGGQQESTWFHVSSSMLQVVGHEAWT
jgi:hypothetical protein